MANIKKIDDSITPGSGEIITNWIEKAECDHDTCPHLDAIMRMLIDPDLPKKYKLARCQMIIDTLKEGLTQIPNA